MVFFFQLLKAAYWSFPCWCVSDLIIFQDQALKESLHEHGVKVSFFWTSNDWISIFSMLPNSGFHQTQARSLICLVHSSLTLWFQVVGAWTIWQTTKASKDTNSLQASFVDVGVDTGAYVDFDLVVHKFLINLQLQTSNEMGGIRVERMRYRRWGEGGD